MRLIKGSRFTQAHKGWQRFARDQGFTAAHNAPLRFTKVRMRSQRLTTIQNDPTVSERFATVRKRFTKVRKALSRFPTVHKSQIGSRRLDTVRKGRRRFGTVQNDSQSPTNLHKGDLRFATGLQRPTRAHKGQHGSAKAFTTVDQTAPQNILQLFTRVQKMLTAVPQKGQQEVHRDSQRPTPQFAKGPKGFATVEQKGSQRFYIHFFTAGSSHLKRFKRMPNGC